MGPPFSNSVASQRSCSTFLQWLMLSGMEVTINIKGRSQLGLREVAIPRICGTSVGRLSSTVCFIPKGSRWTTDSAHQVSILIPLRWRSLSHQPRLFLPPCINVHLALCVVSPRQPYCGTAIAHKGHVVAIVYLSPASFHS